MKSMFVWEYSDKVTDNYHSGGGVLAIADDIVEARRLCAEGGIEADSPFFNKEPDYSALIDAVEDKVFVFPDAGCC